MENYSAFLTLKSAVCGEPGGLLDVDFMAIAAR